jgi:hypothetical protein
MYNVFTECVLRARTYNVFLRGQPHNRSERECAKCTNRRKQEKKIYQEKHKALPVVFSHEDQAASAQPHKEHNRTYMLCVFFSRSLLPLLIASHLAQKSAPSHPTRHQSIQTSERTNTANVYCIVDLRTNWFVQHKHTHAVIARVQLLSKTHDKPKAHTHHQGNKQTKR